MPHNIIFYHPLNYYKSNLNNNHFKVQFNIEETENFLRSRSVMFHLLKNARKIKDKINYLILLMGYKQMPHMRVQYRKHTKIPCHLLDIVS